MVQLIEYLKKQKLGKSYKKIIITILSIPIPFLLALSAFFLGANSTTIVAIASLGTIAIFIPFSAFSYLEYKETKNAEKNYPAFLRDLSQSVSSGMNIQQAISICSDSDYGKLTRYVKQLNIYLSWNLPFPEAWDKFTRLLERSALIKRVNDLLIEAFTSGGDLKTTLNALGDDIVLLKDMESEKKSSMYEQIIIMYVVFFIFLGVVVGLFKILSPIIFIQKIGMFSGFQMTSSTTTEGISINYFKNLFFIMALIEGACAGIIAGQISEERIIAGFKHVIVMVAASILVFFIFIFPAHLSLSASLYPTVVEPGNIVTITGNARYESEAVSNTPVSIILNDGTIIKEFTDATGKFSRNIEAPDALGSQKIFVTITYKKETARTELEYKIE